MRWFFGLLWEEKALPDPGHDLDGCAHGDGEETEVEEDHAPDEGGGDEEALIVNRVASREPSQRNDHASDEGEGDGDEGDGFSDTWMRWMPSMLAMDFLSRTIHRILAAGRGKAVSLRSIPHPLQSAQRMGHPSSWLRWRCNGRR